PEKDAHGMYPIYRLSEDEDHRFAMYMSTSIGAKDVPPHDHTTWAVIVGVQGTEENRFYERIDDGSVPGKGQLKQVGGEMVRPGDCRRHSDQFVELHLYHCPQRLVRQRSIEGAD
ncbi:MAG: hypothetical protein OEU26_32890, partial [Candidatus Tectomicrobia bacterium]|nr:hypothetical protein [Candidatus Tectomicrobia bacterium]